MNSTAVQYSSDDIQQLIEEKCSTPQTETDTRYVLERRKVDAYLRELLKSPTLPVAPFQDPYVYPKVLGKITKRDQTGNPIEWSDEPNSKGEFANCPFEKDALKQNRFEPIPIFTGKNPSFIKNEGCVYLINHRQYQDKMPSLADVNRWLSNPKNGIGTLGGWGNIYWIDVDVKHFESQPHCDQWFERFLNQHPQLTTTWLEKTHSGGYRIAVRLSQTPEFTNFALELGGDHMGEVLGKGRFTVLAPTIGPSGHPYLNINRALPVEIDSLESIGIYPTKGRHPQHAATAPNQSSLSVSHDNPSAIPLQWLITGDCRKILNGIDIYEDRSHSLATLIRELAGWENWSISNQISYRDTPTDLAYLAGQQLGIDPQRVGRIIKTIAFNTCHPACTYKGGEAAAWLKVKHLDKVLFDAKCPPHLKTDASAPQQLDKKTTNKKSSPPKGSRVARELAEQYHTTLQWNIEAQVWCAYEHEKPGTWAILHDDQMDTLVRKVLDTRPDLADGYSYAYLSGVIKLLKTYVGRKAWNTERHKLPFENGVLDLTTMQLLAHSPSYGFTWCLPRPYCELTAPFPKIEQWLDQVTENKAELKQILLCWLNAVLKGRHDLQRFLFLTGPGGSGKGTFVRLMMALIGEGNYFTSTLRDWNSNRFETANAYGKKLVVLQDEDKYSGGLSAFKSLTGEDRLRAEEKGKKAFLFEYFGMTTVVSNASIFTSDTSSGLARRCLLTPMKYQVPPDQRRPHLLSELVEELPALTTFLLAIPDETVTTTLLQTKNQSADVIEQTWEYRMQTDSICAWLNEKLIHEPLAHESVGSDKENKQTLFGCYYQWCERNAIRPKNSRTFSPGLLELCNNILGWKDVKKVKRRNGMLIEGIKLRNASDTHVPFPIEALSQTSQPEGEGFPFFGDGTGEGLEPSLGKGCAECEKSKPLLDKHSQVSQLHLSNDLGASASTPGGDG